MKPAPRVSVQELLELGVQARKRGDYRAALEQFQKAIAAYPRNARAKMEAVRALLRLSRPDEAEAMVRRVLVDNPENVGALLALGQMLRDTGRLDEAEATLRRASKTSPDHAKALRAFIGLLYRRDAARGRAELAALAKAGRVSPGAQIEIAAELREQGHLDDARRELDAAISREPNNIEALMERGRLERRASNREAALAAFRTALQLAPTQVEPYVESAIEERMLGRPQEAERLLRQALTVEPNHLGALLQLTEQARLADQDEAALKWSYQAIVAHPNALQPYLNASRAAVGSGRGDTAISLLDHAATIFGESAPIVGRRLELFRLTGERPKAFAILAGLPAATAENYAVWVQRMELLMASGQYDAADEALKTPPATSGLGLGRVLDFRGQLAEARWRFDEAAAFYREALTIQESDSWSRMWLARAQMLLLDLDAAKENLGIAARLQASHRLLKGHSLNASQSFLGQLLNEFMLDRDVVEELRQAVVLPLSERVTRLQDIVRRAPDNTAASICLLLALRIAGRLQGLTPPGSPSQPAIPRRIVQYWNDAEPPEGVLEIMQSWTDLHPGWDYYRFDDARAQAFLRANHPLDVLRAYMRARSPAQKADLFRLAYLVVEGGFYADADDRSLARLDTIVPAHVEIATYQEIYGTVGNNFLAAKAGEPVLLKALESAVEAVNRGDHDLLWLSSGPGLMTRTMAQFFSDPNEQDKLFSRALVLDRSELFRAVAVHCQLRYKRSDDHWTRGEFRVSGKKEKAPADKAGPVSPGVLGSSDADHRA